MGTLRPKEGTSLPVAHTECMVELGFKVKTLAGVLPPLLEM